MIDSIQGNTIQVPVIFSGLVERMPDACLIYLEHSLHMERHDSRRKQSI